MVQTVLFACVQNAGRSQMGKAMFNLLADPSKAREISAGTQPVERAHPKCVAAMNELGINMTNEKPKLLTPEVAPIANSLITMRCGEACPYVPGLGREDWPLQDPKGKSPELVKRIWDDVQKRVQEFLAPHRWEMKLDQEGERKDI